MKPSIKKQVLLAVAMLGVAGAASAQSQVTLFGVLDASVSHYRVSGSKGVSPASPARQQTVLANGANAPSRLGLRGSESLGGGLTASFWLEAPLGNDSGSMETRPFDFSRRSTVSLSGPFGEIRLGRDNTPTDWNDVLYSPFGPQSVGGSTTLQAAGINLTPYPFLPGDMNAVRASNSVGYFLPRELGGFYGQFMYAFPENVQTQATVAGGGMLGVGSAKGRYVGGRLGYAQGPVDIALAYGESTLSKPIDSLAALGSRSQQAGAYDAKVRTINLGGSYDLGFMKLMGALSSVSTRFQQPALFGLPGGLPLRAGVDESTRQRSGVLGALIPVGAGQIKLAYSWLNVRWPRSAVAGALSGGGPRFRKLAVGYVHNLSKRTALYASAAVLSNRDGGALPVGGGGNSITPITGSPNARATGYELGMRHSF